MMIHGTFCSNVRMQGTQACSKESQFDFDNAVQRTKAGIRSLHSLQYNEKKNINGLDDITNAE